MADYYYPQGRVEVLAAGGANVELRVMLMKVGFQPNTSNVYVSDVVAQEVAGIGYTGGFNGSGRLVLAGKTVTYDASAGKATLKANDLEWTGLALSDIGGAHVIKPGTTEANSKLVGFFDLENFGMTLLGFKLSWNAAGIFRN